MNLPAPLEAAIVAAPDEAAPYSVAADWLQARGDPLGELVALMQGLEHEQHPAQFLAKKHRREELLRAHGTEWLGGSTPDVLLWRWGFVWRARLEVEHLDAFLGSPAGRFVRDLEVHGPAGEVAASLAQTAPRVLRGLALVGGPLAPSFKLAKVLRSVSLERLGLVSVNADFTGVSATGVRDLRVRDVRHPTLTAFLSTLEAPALEHLELCVDAPLGLKSAAVAHCPKLRSLHVEDDQADALALWAAKAPVVRHLDALSLCGPMTDRGLDALLLESSRLARLQHLELEGGFFSGGLRRMAYRQLPAMVFHTSRTPWAFW